jgi:hypothetical protein
MRKYFTNLNLSSSLFGQCTQDTIVIMCANNLKGSEFFLAALGQKWYPVCQLLFKDHILLLILERMRWHTGFQSAPLRIPNWNPVQSTGSQNENRFY